MAKLRWTRFTRRGGTSAEFNDDIAGNISASIVGGPDTKIERIPGSRYFRLWYWWVVYEGAPVRMDDKYDWPAERKREGVSPTLKQAKADWAKAAVELAGIQPVVELEAPRLADKQYQCAKCEKRFGSQASIRGHQNKTGHSGFAVTGERPECECGCGGTPAGKRSRFLPGHDAKKASAEKAAAAAA